ncbi:MAG: helix-turn-helix transcriptional regulator [Planctomycetes bacterium]|nr:helix-turn-helix transcriptional regulator [Planctomycetota bacterium]
MIKSLSKAVRSRRLKAGLSQEDLAFEAEIHPTYVSLVERGKRNPTILVLAALARALGTSMTSIIREVEAGVDGG